VKTWGMPNVSAIARARSSITSQAA
jgi:hypothetical protein